MPLAATTPSLEFGVILIGLLGGLALFLFGMDQMADSLKLVAGGGMKQVLATLTTNRFTGALAGAFVTAVIQSSSVTTVLIVGFISAGLMNLTQSIGVIMGANIGTTITAQIIAFKITKYALLMVAVGFTMLFFFPQQKAKHYGNMLMGLGLVFFGMSVMSEATSPLRDYGPFRSLMGSMENPLYGILLAAVFTAAVQSSSATTGLVIALAMNGNITLEAGIAMIFGANVGTCVTAMLAAIGKSREAVRAAGIHVLFNLAGVAVWFAFIPQLADLTVWLSPTAPQLTGAEQLAAVTPRQIANAHTVFNVANMLLFIWFATPMAWLVHWIVPDRAEVGDLVMRPKYLDDLLLQTPVLAMDMVRRELGRVGAAVIHMAQGALQTVIHGSAQELDRLRQRDNDVDNLHGAIVTYLGRLSQENLSDEQTQQVHDFLASVNYLENIGDMVETNLVDAGKSRLQERLRISGETEQVLETLHRKVCWSVERAVAALVEQDPAQAALVTGAKREISQLVRGAEEHLSRRLAAPDPNRLAAFRLESEIMEYLKRMYYFAKRIAKIATDEDYRSAGSHPSAVAQPQTAEQSASANRSANPVP